MTKARDLADYIATGVSDTELDILDGLTTTTAELNYNATGAAVGTVVASKTVTVDANKDASSFRNLTMAGNLSIGGDVVTVSNANLDLAPDGSGTVVVKGNDNSAAVVFNCESNSHGQKVFGQPHSAGVTNTLMLPAGANSTLVSLVSTDTLTNKTLTSPKVNEDVAVTSTATEINLIDGDTARGTIAVADGDGFLTNDGGTMRMTKVDTLATYMQNKIIGGTSIVTTGALDSGSITSGFGNIDTGASTITTTGLISGGSLDIDNVFINGTTIGHTDDTDLITLADGVVTVAGELSVTTLDIGGTNVTASAADLNLIDGITNGTVIASKAIITDSNKDITGLRNVTATGAITGGSFVIGSADINENDLESIDGITAGTIAASKAAVVDANKDITGFRNITLSGELDAATLDISGAIDVAGNSVLASVDIDNITINGNTISSTDTNGDINLSPNGTGKVHITNDSTVSTLIVESTIDGSQTAPDIDLYKNSASPANSDFAGNILFHANNSNDDKHLFAQIASQVQDATAGAEDGSLQLWSYVNGVNYNRLWFASGGLVINESGINSYTRIEGSNDANLVYVDAANDRVGIGKSNPSELLDVDGTLNTTNLKIGGAQGSDGQVLTSTGSGVAFEDAAGGASALVGSAILTSAAASITATGFSTSYDTYRVNALIISADDGLEYANIRWTQDDGTEYASGVYGWRKMQFNSNSSIVNDPKNDNSMFEGQYLQIRQDQEAGTDFHLTVSHPKNNLASANLSGFYNEAFYNNGTTFIRGNLTDKDLDIGGIKFFFESGDNIAVGSYIRIYGLNKS